MWVAFLGAQATSWTLKFLVGRVRPEFLEIASASSSSFPSGHTTAATTLYGFLAWVVLRHGPSEASALSAAGVATMSIVLIGFSRIFLGVHHATDVLGGFLVGGFWLLAGIALITGTTPAHKRLEKCELD